MKDLMLDPTTGQRFTGRMAKPWYNRLPLKSTIDPVSDLVFVKLAAKFGRAEIKADMKSMDHDAFAAFYAVKPKS